MKAAARPSSRLPAFRVLAFVHGVSSFFASEPSAFITQTCVARFRGPLSREEVTARRQPSGDHAGEPL